MLGQHVFDFVKYVKDHPMNFINYCEIMINPFGRIIMCNPSHEQTAIKWACYKEKKTKQEEALNALEANVENLENKQSQSDSLIEKFNQQSEENIKAIQAAERAEEQLQAEIRKELSEKGDSEFVGGDFLWPVSGYHMITSKFGMRTHPVTGVYKLHTGVDISGSGINGKPVRAANSGKVLKAGYNSGYGNYVVIDHGGGCSTLYGHASRLNVKVGQKVSRGDVIMYVGSTGYSTGPHLHFEVIKNGEYTNPLSYFNIKFKFV
jgi:murein DD-endopeptidase MepM/ murein hydrolase activator NlpD